MPKLRPHHDDAPRDIGKPADVVDAADVPLLFARADNRKATGAGAADNREDISAAATALVRLAARIQSVRDEHVDALDQLARLRERIGHLVEHHYVAIEQLDRLWTATLDTARDA